MIRPATVADAGAVAGVQLRGWLHAYSEIVDPETLAAAAPGAERWGALLRAGGTLVFDQDGVVVGFASVGAARDDDARAGTGELYALYVEPAAQGAGVGSALLRAAEDELRAGGFEEATLWVFEANGLARRVYERHGWALDADGPRGDHPWALEVRYRRRL